MMSFIRISGRFMDSCRNEESFFHDVMKQCPLQAKTEIRHFPGRDNGCCPERNDSESPHG